MASETAPADMHAKTLRQTLADGWWLLLLRGLVAVFFGILTFAWPGITLMVLVLICGGLAPTDGIFALLGASARSMGSWKTWWAILSGVAGVAAGLITFLWPGLTALALSGILLIVLSLRLRNFSEPTTISVGKARYG